MEADFSECAGCLCLAARRAARAITRAFDKELRACGLRTTQFSVLVMLSLRGSTMIGALAGALGVDRTTLSRNLAPMETNGWVRSRAGDDDARLRYVEITEKGKRLMARALPAWRKAQQATSEAIGAPAAVALLKLSRRAMN